MEVSFRSRTKKDISYCFSDLKPNDNQSPHLRDNFSYSEDQVQEFERFKAIIKDCASPELAASEPDGIQAVIRYIKALGVKAQPLYVYRIDSGFYSKLKVA